jgi:hypothetical protein
MHRLTAPAERDASSATLAPYCSSISMPGWTPDGRVRDRVQQRLVYQQLVGADSSRLSRRRRRRQPVQVTLQAVAMVSGQDQQDPVVRLAAGRRAGRGHRGAGGGGICHDEPLPVGAEGVRTPS